MKNKYIYHSKISEIKFRQIVKLFALDLTATQITELTGLNPKTVDSLVNKMRMRILLISESERLQLLAYLRQMRAILDQNT